VLGKNTLSEKKDNGKGKEEVIEFEELDLEDSKEEDGSNKITELKDFLKENLKPDKYADSLKILGIDEAMSNEQLLEAITELFLQKKKPEEEEEEEEDEEAKKKKAAEAAELEEKGEEKKDAPDRKEFMEKCMKEGKSLAECNAEYKEKYPAPKEDEEKKAADVDEKDEAKELTLPEDVRKEFDELKAEIGRLKDERRLADITHKVDTQIAEKHLAPVQKPQVIKLMSKLPDAMHEDFLSTFSNVKFKGFEDVGKTSARRPGEPEELDEELRLKLLKDHGIADLILERGVRRPDS